MSPNPIQILVVDDEQELCALSKDYLEMSNMEVEIAFSVAEARLALGSKRFDIVVSDYQMPIEDGIQFLKWLRDQGNSIPFILFTGKGREEVVIEALNSGADSYLQKGGKPKPLYKELEHRIRVAVHRRQAEDALQESEERYKRISETTTDFVFSSVRSDGGEYAIDWMAGDVEGILGYSLEEMRAMRCWGRLVLPIDMATFHENVTNLPLGTSRECMLRIRTKNGGVRWLAVSTTHTPSKRDRSCERVFGGCTDITERKRAEEALHISEGRFHELAELLPATIFEMDLNGILTYWNKRAYAMLGPTDDGTDSVPAFAMLMPAELERAEENFQRIMEGEDIGPIEYHMRRRDGTSFSALVNATIILQEERPVGIRGVVVDISASKRVEEELRESEARFKQLAEQARTVTWEIQVDGLFTYVSSAAAAVWGYHPDELVGKRRFFELVPEAHRASTLAMTAEAFQRNERFVDLESRVQTKDGDMRWISINALPLLDEEGVLRGYQGSATDIEERKQAEMALAQRNEELQRVNKELAAAEERSAAQLQAISAANAEAIETKEELRKSVERFRLLFRNMNALFSLYEVVLDEQGSPCDYRYLEANQAYERFTNKKSSELIGRTLLEVFPQTEQHWLQRFAEVCRTGTPVHLENYSREMDSHVELDIYCPQKGQLAMISLDVSERKRAEGALQRQSAMLALLNEIISTANSGESLEQLLDSALAGSLRLLDFDAGGIYLVDRRTRTANVVCSRNLSSEFLAGTRSLPIDEKHYEALFIRNEPIITEEFARFNPDLAHKFGFRSMASIPLSSKGETIGALNVVSMRRHMISQDEKQVLVSICRELGNSIERLVSEAEAKTAAKNLQVLFHSIEEMVFVLDMKGNILAVNDAVQKRLLYKEKELVGTNVLLLHIPERREEALQIVQGMIAGTISSCPVPIQAKDGTRIEVETKVARGRWNGQDVLFGVSRDISERRRTERALQESEDKYRLLVQNANVAIVVLQDGLVKLVNPTAIAKMGFTESVLKARPFLSFVHPDDRATVMERHQMRLEGIPSPDEYEVRLLTQRGDTLWAEVHAIAIVWEGRPAALNFINDITERKQLERALREASRKLALLSSVTRHDITNQLQVLKGRLALLEMENPGSSKFDHLQRAEAAAAQISTMIDFTKEYEDIGITAPVWMSPGGHMASVFAALHPIGVTLENNMGGLEVLADPLAEKVPYNLVDNSMRHGENVTRIKLSARQVGDALLIVYEDDGVGISDEDRKRIFEKGFGKNSGLGLFLTREILAITGITFTENGKAGEGVRFEMLVPAGAWRYGK